MKRNKILIVFFAVFCMCLQNVFADIPVTIQINNVDTNGGKIYGYINFSERTYKNKIEETVFLLNPSNSVIFHEINLPEGECVVSIFQDNNGNGILDTGLLNIPKEPVGLTNYSGGIPGNYNKLKIVISNNNSKIIIPLITF